MTRIRKRTTIRLILLGASIGAIFSLASACGRSRGGSTPTPTPTPTSTPPAPAPVIAAVAPTSGLVGTTIHVTGANFGATQGASSVTVDGAAATVVAWSDGAIDATVPAGAYPGADDVVVTVDAEASAPASFRVLLPPALYGVTDTSPDAVVAWSIGTAGTLTSLAGSPLVLGTAAGAGYVGDSRMIRLHERTRRVFAVSAMALHVFDLDPVTGALTTAGAPVLVSGSALLDSLAVAPDGRRVFAADAANALVWTASADANGAFGQTPPAPASVGVTPAVPLLTPDGKYLYVLEQSGRFAALAVGSSGALTPLAGSPFSFGGSASSSVHTATMDAGGKFLFFPDEANGIYVYAIGSSGVPALVAGSPFGGSITVQAGGGVAVTPDARHLYVQGVGITAGQTFVYDVATNGALTANASSPYDPGITGSGGTSSVEVSGDGRFLYTVLEGTDPGIYGFSISTSGALAPLADAPYASGVTGQSISGLAATH